MSLPARVLSEELDTPLSAGDRPSLIVIPGGLAPSSVPAPAGEATSATNSLFVLAAILAALQVGDLGLTLLGVSQFGHAAEGNPLLRFLMAQWGAVPALMVAKVIAIAIIFALAKLAHRVTWIPSAMKALIVAYTLGAIIPWSTVLLLHFS